MSKENTSIETHGLKSSELANYGFCPMYHLCATYVPSMPPGVVDPGLCRRPGVKPVGSRGPLTPFSRAYDSDYIVSIDA